MSELLTEAFLGVDVGTESARALLIDPCGVVIREASVEYPIVFLGGGRVEQDPHAILGALFRAVRDVSKSVPGVTIHGLSLASTAVSVVAIDRGGTPIGQVISWMDHRAGAEADEITRTRHRVLRFTGGAVSPEWMLPKALWLKRNDFDRYQRALYVVELHDWLMFRLTGEWALSLATIAAEWSYCLQGRGWPEDLLDEIGLADVIEKWPAQVLNPGEVLGFLQPDAAREMGLAPGLVVAQGMMDSYAAAVACNVFRAGTLSLSLGSSSCYLALAARPIVHPGLLGPVPGALGHGRWVIQGGQTSAAILAKWFRGTFAPTAEYKDLDAEAATIAPGCDGLIALDAWAGSRSPYRDPSMRGAFFGLTLMHERAHVYRALLEAVAYGGGLIVDLMKQRGLEIRSVVACGGGAESDLWMQIHADVLQQPLAVLAHRAAPAIGAAIMASVGAGIFTDLEEATGSMTRLARTFEPNPTTQAAYAQAYESYTKLYSLQRLFVNSAE